MYQRLGFVCGLKSEAACLPEGAAAAISGAHAGRAEEGARALALSGVDALVSFGISGALDPALKPGDLLIANIIRTERETFAGSTKWADALWTEARAAGLPARRVILYGSDQLIVTAAEKRALRDRGDAVDMESHAVARAAQAAGVDFVALRAVADPASRALPRAAHHAVDEAGGTRLLSVFAGLARRPWELPALMALGEDSQRGHAGLKRLSTALG